MSTLRERAQLAQLIDVAIKEGPRPRFLRNRNATSPAWTAAAPA